jgi:outer membrane receptor for ferric coprogen and ferric-rhodotorulic acid
MFLWIVAPLAAAEAPRNFDVPAGSAETTLKLFSEQSGRGVIFSTDGVKGITTNPVRGQFAIRDALDRLVSRTGLTVRYDERSGSFSIVRPPPSPTAGGGDAKFSPNDKKKEPEPMKPAKSRVPLFAWLALALGPSADAQAAVNPAKDETIMLSPFEVIAETDKGYAATSTLSGARMATNLKDTPAMISVMTREFLDDIGAQSVADFGNWAPNTVVFGIDNNVNTRDRDLVQPALRGVGGGMTRNYFGTSVPIDSFNIDRLESSRGPNALLFGDGPLGGLTTSNTKRALFGRAISSANFVVDDWGSMRASFDVNRELVNQKIAGRLNVLAQRNEGWRDSEFYDRDSINGTLTYRPFRTTQIRADGEWGRTSRDGELTNYTDSVFLWDGVTTALSPNAAGAGTGTVRVSTTTPWYVFNMSRPELGMKNFQNGLRSSGSGFSVLPADVASYGYRPGRPTAPYLERRTRTLNPHQKGSDLAYANLSLFLEQSIGKLAVELAFNYDTNKRNWLRTGTTRPSSILMDLSPTLLDGTNNPGFMRPYGEGPVNLSYAQGWGYNYRVTAAYPFNLKFTTQKLVVMATESKSEGIESYRRLVRVDNPTLRNALQTANNMNVRRYWDDPVNAPMVIPDAGTYEGVAFDWRRGNVGGNKADNLGVQTALVGGYFKNRLTTILGYRRDQTENDTRLSWATSNDWELNGIRSSDYRPLLKGETTAQLLDPRGSSQGIWNSQRMDLIDNTRPYDPVKNPRWSEQYPIKKKKDTFSAGIVWFPINAVGAFVNASSGFAGVGWAQKINFEPVEPPSNKGIDGGLKLELFGGRLSGSISTYRSEQVGYASTGSGTQFYNIYQAAISGYQQAATNDPANAATYQTKVDQAQNRSNGFLPNIAYFDTQNTSAKGYELDVTGRLTKNWSVSVNAALPKAFTTNRLNDTKAAYAANIAQINAYLADTAIPAANRNTITTQLNNLNNLLSGGVDGFPLANRTKYTLNVYNSYRFSEGRLKGLRLGGGVQARGEFDIATARQIYGVNPANNTTQFYAPNPLENVKGAGYNLYTAMLGYERKLGKLTWNLQLNVSNLLDEDKLVFTSYNTYTYVEGGVTKGVQVPNGFRYLDPRKTSLTISTRF